MIETNALILGLTIALMITSNMGVIQAYKNVFIFPSPYKPINIVTAIAGIIFLLSNILWFKLLFMCFKGEI